MSVILDSFLTTATYQPGRTLAPGAVDLWWWYPPAVLPPHWREWLSPAEAEALAGWRTPARQQEYLAGHAFLRWVLSQYLEVPPAEVPVTFPGGQGPQVPVPLRCSLSHSYGAFACAVGQVSRLGVDAEWLDRPWRPGALARRFTPAEETTWTGPTPANGPLGLWTLKEAFFKAAAPSPLQAWRDFSFEVEPLRLHASEALTGPHPWAFWRGQPRASYVLSAAASAPVPIQWTRRFTPKGLEIG